MKKILITSALMLSLTLIAHAESGSGRTGEDMDNRPPREDRPMKQGDMPMRPMQQLRQERNGEIKDTRVEFKDDRREMRSETKMEIKGNRVETREEVRDLRKNGEKGDVKPIMEKMRMENKTLREDMRTKMEARKTEFKTTIKNQIAQFKEGKKVVLDQKKKENITGHLKEASGKLKTAIANIEAFQTRLSEVIAKRSAAGEDVTGAQDALKNATSATEEAKVKISAVEEAITTALSDATGVSKEAVKSAINTAVESIKTAREATRAVIESLPKREKEVETEIETSSDSETETTN